MCHLHKVMNFYRKFPQVGRTLPYLTKVATTTITTPPPFSFILCDNQLIKFSAIRKFSSFKWYNQIRNSKIKLAASQGFQQAQQLTTELTRMASLSFNAGTFKYPHVRRQEDSTYTAFGVEVKDPYRWLEDADSPETKQFVDAQNELSEPYIKSCPARDQIISRLREIYNYPRYGPAFKKGNNYFMYQNSGLQNQSVLYIMRGGLHASPEEFFDPNKLSQDGTVALSAYTNKFSKDGKWFAYGLNASGSDWINVKVKNVDTLVDLPDQLNRLKFATISWTHDNKGFFYSAYSDSGDGTETTECAFQKLYYHRLNTPQSQDVLIYECPDQPHYRFTNAISDCGQYLHVFTNKSCQYNLWHYYRFDDPLNPNINGPLKLEPLVTEYNGDYYYIGNDGPRTYIRTNLNASNFRLTVADLTNANTRIETNWKDLVPEHPKDVLEDVHIVRQDVLVVQYNRDVTSHIQLHKLSDGSLIKEVEVPMGTISGLSAERHHDELFFNFTSFLIPGIVYQLKLEQDLQQSCLSIIKEAKPNNFDRNKFVTKQVFYTSKDGTKVPMFLVHRKDVVQDGNNPCLLYAYGGFNISVMPSFSVTRLILMDHLNGVFALANIRGGGEYGEKWHKGAQLEKKQNCFDDFIAAGEYLVREKYTSSDKLCIQGGSNGGLLMGAVCNQRPDLFGLAFAHVGVMDLLRFHKFTIGHAWMSEYGNPDEEKDFRNLVRLSPVHNVPDADSIDRFPAILVLTADHDDRVVPLHSFKHIAELQYKLGHKFNRVPIMARIDVKAGHGFGKPTEKIIEEYADIYSFMINALNLEYHP